MGAGRVRVLLATVLLWSFAATTHAQGSLEPTQGFGWDLELDGGVGVGVQRQLRNNFLGRLRVGALYVGEPWVYALGVTGEVGGLAEYGAGLTLSVSHFDGFWARLGGSRVAGDDWMTHATLGYLFFGVEWQHRLDSSRVASDALMMVFRVPVGVWWFLMREQQPVAPQRSQRVEPFRDETADPRLASVPSVTAVSAGDHLLSARLLEEAAVAEQQEHWVEAEELLARAARLDPSPLLTLRLARVQRRVQHLVAAADNLRRFIDAAVTAEELDARTQAERERLEVLSLLSYLRLRVEPLAEQESVWLDGQAFSVAALGYPYPIDPGSHLIVVKRGEQEILRREVSVAPGGNLTLKLDPTAPPAREAAESSEGSESSERSEPSEHRALDVGTGTGEPAR